MEKNSEQNPNSAPIVRMAPSPTGNLHIGTARTTLSNYLFAKKHGGKFIMRIEDTDKERSTKEFEQNIIDNLTWLGLSWDEFYRQSERTSVYVSYLKKMVDNGSAYISKEETREEGKRSEVVRFKNPNKQITFNDLIRGEVTFDTTELKDFVIAKSLEEPLYHLAVVVDDHEMNVTHVIRGEDHISNTPRQILIQEAIGAIRPIYAHLPLILAPDKSKMSKRKHGESVWVDTYKKEGFLPYALNNYLALLGWNPGDNREIFDSQELLDAFEIERVHKSGAIFNKEKLEWINKEHLKKISPEERDQKLREFVSKNEHALSKGWNGNKEILKHIYPLIFERINRWGEIDGLIDRGEFDFFFEKPAISSEILFWKNEKDVDSTVRHIDSVKETLATLEEESWNLENIKEKIWGYAEKEGKGNVLWPMRTALSGLEKSPDPFTIANILGKKETLERLKEAKEKLQ